MVDFVGEKIKSESTNKKVFHYYDTSKKIDQISREVYKKIDQIVHFPRGFEGGPKYKTIEKFIFKGFKGKLPIGVFKSANYGWGFTKPLRPFGNYLNEKCNIKEVVIEKGGIVQLDNKNRKLYLNETFLQKLQDNLSSIFKKNKEGVDLVLKSVLHDFFPNEIKKPKRTYTSNALAATLAAWGNSINEFSTDDKKAIQELFEKLSLATNFLNKSTLDKTKEIVDVKYLQEALKKFQKLIQANSDSKSLEKKWQQFLQEHSWIFSSLFAQPVILYQREAYVGGKRIDNTNGKFNDFLIKNSLSNNVSFLEIKTHKTPLLEGKSYRGDDVFSASKDLTGCIAQVLNQRDNFQKEFYANQGKSNAKNFETFNSKCIVLIGSIANLSKAQLHSFELFRSNCKDVEVVSFDELQKKIESLQKIMTDKPNKSKKKAKKK